MVEMLVERFPLACIGSALQVAAENRQYAVVELLLRSCEAKHDASIFTTIGMAAETAATCGDAEMARLLVKKSTIHSAGRTLNIAVSRNDLEMVKVFASKRGEYYKADAYKTDALVRAAKDKQMEVVEILLNSSNKRTKEEAGLQLAPAVNSEVLATILEKYKLETYQYIFADAAARGLVGLVQLLACRVNSNSILGRSMVTAASNGHIEVVKTLLDNCDLSSLADAVEAAIRNGHTSVAKLLLDRVVLLNAAMLQ